MPSVDSQSTHLMRTTCHCVAHSEQVQNRVPWAPFQPTIADATGAPPQAGQTPSPIGTSAAGSSRAASRAKCTCSAAAT